MNQRALCISLSLLLAACGADQTTTSSQGGTSGSRSAVVAGSSGNTIAFAGNRADYTIAASGSGFTVSDAGGSVAVSASSRVQFADVTVAFDTEGTAGKVYRVYQAAFDRTPDAAGLGFWINAVDGGVALKDVAAGFIASTEFKTLYGASPGNDALIAAFYNNVLHRAADAAGQAFWVNVLNTKAATTADVLAGFSESPENKALVLGAIANGIAYMPSARISTSSAPGAPVASSAIAGSGSAAVTFAAPSSNGGSAITSYTASCTAGASTLTASAIASPVSVSGLANGTQYSCTVKATNAIGSSAASNAVLVTPASLSSSITGHLYCPYSASVLNSGLNLASTVAMSCTTSSRSLTGNGVPDHTTGAFPNSGNPNTIKAVNVSFTNTLNPAVVNTSGTAVAHILGFANNGVKFDPSTAESYQNAGVWKIEALNQSYFPFGVDTSNAHVQPDGAYHYHGMPEAYITRLGKGQAMTLVGFAVDGFPIYARYGYTTAASAASALKVMAPSYRMKTSPASGRPSTGSVPMGTFTQDYEYVSGLGDLDECNGRTGVTPEFPNGIYHYYITDAYPYIQRCVKGTPASTQP